MTYTIRYTPYAVNDLDAVWDGEYEASKRFGIADRYVQELIKQIAEKKSFPQSGSPLTYRGMFTGFYSVSFKAYMAFYRIRENNIEVLRIIMAKRDYMTILFGDS